MRIPLDYYRILGLPIQATADQLRQAHRDRTLQLPRREYSEAAIASRRQLIDLAYTVLSDAEQRQAYDSQLVATTYDQDAGDGRSEVSPTIDIEEPQLVGALLVLQELGEYELVLKIGRPYLSSGTANLKDGEYGDPRMVLPDIVLTVALACLELGREQWQQGQYENAAEALETGQELLLREGLFASVRGEIQTDLYKLRPYRILELLALGDGYATERQQGLRLLKNMLRERGGIDGNGNDQSGLSIDDFLRFIQQLRGYLTAEEQQSLFEEEARRPSAVATYLTVYALLARGFAEQQPALIRRAKAMLLRLGHRQDVHLEQSVCALLLGQTEEASRALELSQEYEPLAFIRENSQGAPDLLPGLCLYAERWLQDEVFPHFRDLAKQEASLKAYFADQHVQEYLEELPIDTEVADDLSFAQRGFDPKEIAYTHAYPERNGRFNQKGSAGLGARSATATLTADADVATMPPAERLSRVSPEGRLQNGGTGRSRYPDESHRPVQRKGKRPSGEARYQAPDTEVPRRGEGAKATRKNRLPLLLFGIAAAGLLGFAIIRSLKAIVSPSKSPTQAISVQVAPTTAPTAAPATASLSGDMNAAMAQKAIETWFDAKKAAMGSTYNTEALKKILINPRLAEWQRNSEESKQEELSIEYTHSVQVNGVEVNPTDPQQATVTATVTEVRKYFKGNQASETQSDRDMQIRYTLVRQDNQWRIKDWK